MERIRRFFKKFGKGLKAKGYTLLEVAAVVAVSATLAAVVLPIVVDKVQDGKLVAAKQDVQTIATAITGFNKDTGIWPAVSLTATEAGATVNSTTFAVLRSGATKANAVVIETSNSLVTGNTGFDPAAGASTAWTGKFGHLDEQFVTRPAGLTTSYNWKGPYVESYKKRDPWGNNYLVFVKAMHTPTGEGASDSTRKYGWIISAGPDGMLQTEPTDSVIKGDDIGLMLFSATATRAAGTTL